tara:strand:- start:426 stop:665 length:240 start_codon:yes stop_codon:yes gene_type:complete
MRQTMHGGLGADWIFGRLNEFRKTHFGGGADAEEVDFDFHAQYLNADDGGANEDVQGTDDEGDEMMPMRKKTVGQGDAL